MYCRSAKGKGAITDISVTSLNAGGPPLVVAASADKVIRVLEPRKSFQVLHHVADHKDFIYSLYTSGTMSPLQTIVSCIKASYSWVFLLPFKVFFKENPQGPNFIPREQQTVPKE